MKLKCIVVATACFALALVTSACGSSTADSYQEGSDVNQEQADTAETGDTDVNDEASDAASEGNSGDTTEPSTDDSETNDDVDNGDNQDETTDDSNSGSDTNTDDNTDAGDDNSSQDDNSEVDYGDIAGNGAFEQTREDGVELPGADGRVITTTICTPTTGTEHSIVLVSPGFQLGRELYESYCAHLASWGFIAVLQTYSESGFFMSHGNLAADTTGLLDWLETDGAANFPSWNGKMGLVGHSLGGKLSLLAASQDSRIGAVVALDPVDSDDVPVAPDRMQDVEAPVLILGEMLDSTGSFQACAPEADNFRQFFEASRPGTIEIELFGVGHMDFLDNPNCLFCSFCQSGDLGDDVVKEIARRSIVGFFGKHLNADNGFDRYIAGQPVQDDAQEGILSIRTR
jgi:dienelactone hydrolase